MGTFYDVQLICYNLADSEIRKINIKYFEFKLLKSSLFESNIICGSSAVTVGTSYFLNLFPPCFLNARAWDHSQSCCR